MDNFTIDITSEGDETLTKALEIAFAHNAPGAKATHYSVVKLAQETSYYANKAIGNLSENLKEIPGMHIHHFEKYKQDDNGHLTLILLWSESNGAVALPYPMKITDAIPFVKGWLENAGDPGKEPDMDGSLDKGWRVFTGAWGHVAGCSCAVVGVQACYAMYGK